MVGQFIQQASAMGLVAIGGAVGSLLRYGAGRFMSAAAPGVAPMAATLGVNLVGSMILGGVVAGLGANPRQHGWVLLLGVGLCGGLTTFSTLAMELADLMHAKRYWGAMLYGVGSLVVGVVMFMLGVWIVRRWVGVGEVV